MPDCIVKASKSQTLGCACYKDIRHISVRVGPLLQCFDHSWWFNDRLMLYLLTNVVDLFAMLCTIVNAYASGEDKRHMLAAKDWFLLSRKTDGHSLAWIPEPVKLDTHDEENMNRIFVLPDHTLVIRNFQPCASHVLFFRFVVDEMVCILQ